MRSPTTCGSFRSVSDSRSAQALGQRSGGSAQALASVSELASPSGFSSSGVSGGRTGGAASTPEAFGAPQATGAAGSTAKAQCTYGFYVESPRLKRPESASGSPSATPGCSILLSSCYSR